MAGGGGRRAGAKKPGGVHRGGRRAGAKKPGGMHRGGRAVVALKHLCQLRAAGALERRPAAALVAHGPGGIGQFPLGPWERALPPLPPLVLPHHVEDDGRLRDS